MINDFIDMCNKYNKIMVFLFIWFDIEKSALSVKKGVRGIYKLKSAVTR